MSLPKVVGREEWVAARRELLAREKDLTQQRDALNIERRNLPMVEIEKDYVFDGPTGPVRLIDMFEGRPQLIMYHFMFDPEWEEGCPSCTAGTDELSPGFFEHLRVAHQLRWCRRPGARRGRPRRGGTSLVLLVRNGLQLQRRHVDESVGQDRTTCSKAEYEAMGSPSSMPSNRSAAGRLFLGVDGACSHVLAVRRGLESTGAPTASSTSRPRPAEEWRSKGRRLGAVRPAGLRVVQPSRR
jgi:hypothetical protein